MKSMIVQCDYDWRTRFSLTKDKGEYVLKIKLYKLKGNDNNKGYSPEIHLFSGDVVRKLKKFLNQEVKSEGGGK